MRTPEQIAPHMARFLDMLDAAFRRFGADGLPDCFRHAVAATPRHLFVHRYRVADGPLRTRDDTDPMDNLSVIYSDAVMTHVDATGDRLRSTNSQPSYVLWLLHLLDLEPGQRVLEIGSGSGWLAAIMAHLVGPTGHVTGLELIPDLAEQSRADLARLDIGNVSVLTTDGMEGHAAGAPYHRAMITAGVWDVPAALFDQVATGGRLLAPIELRGGGCHVASMRRERDGFVADRTVPGWFVPLLGPSQRRPSGPITSSETELGEASRRAPLPLATGPEGADSAVRAFRAFLGRTVPHFAVFGAGEDASAFGIFDPARRSAAYWRAGALFGAGGPAALSALVDAYAKWTSLGMPGVTGMGLTVQRSGEPAEPVEWRDDRGDSVLVWSCLSDAEAWRSLLSSDVDAGLP